MGEAYLLSLRCLTSAQGPQRKLHTCAALEHTKSDEIDPHCTHHMHTYQQVKRRLRACLHVILVCGTSWSQLHTCGQTAASLTLCKLVSSVMLYANSAIV